MGRQKKRICGMGGLLAAALVMILAGSAAEPAPVYGGTPEKKVDALSYHMNLKLNARKDRLYETVTMKVKNNTGKTVTTLCIQNMAPEVLDYAKRNYGENNLGKEAKIRSVCLGKNGQKMKVTRKRGRSWFYVKLGKKNGIRPGKTGTVTVRMWTDIPDREDRFGVVKTKRGKLYMLSFCFPYLADNRNGRWITDPYFDDGESRSTDLADYSVRFEAPKRYTVAAVGSSRTKKGVTEIRAKQVRDFAVAACDFMKKDRFTVSGIHVNSYWLKGSRYLKQYRKAVKLTAKDSIRLFTSQIGPCPYQELDIVPGFTGFLVGGMEFPGMGMVNASQWFDGSYYDGLSLAASTAHEIGHQWFYAAVGNREYKEAWLDEGFTTYVERELFEVTPGAANTYIRSIDSFIPPIRKIRKENEELLASAREDYAGMKINCPPDHYPKGQNYSTAEYDEARMFLCEVRRQMGHKRFADFLKTYYRRFYMKTVTTKEAVALIRSYDNSRAMNEIIRFYIR